MVISGKSVFSCLLRSCTRRRRLVRRRRAGRGILLEQLEPRVLLSAAAVDVSGNLSVMDVATEDNNITFEIDGANLRISDTAGITAGTGATQDGANSVTILLTSLTGDITIDGGDGTDVVTFDSLPAVTGTLSVTAETGNLNTDLTAGAFTGGLDLVNVAAGASIQDGVDLVAAGGTVSVSAGTYLLTGNITLDKSLTILGPNAGISPVTDLGSRSAEATIDGNGGTVDGAGFGIVLASGITSLTVEGLSFTNFDGNVFASSIVPVTAVNLHQNIFDGNNGGLFYKFDTSVATDFDVVDNLIQNHSMTGINTALFFLGNVANSHFDGNQGSNIASRELFNIYNSATDSTFNNNKLTNTAQLVGLNANASNIEINNNTLSSLSTGGLYVSTYIGQSVTDVEIQNNNLTGINGIGIQLITANNPSPPAAASITNVTIDGNTISGTTAYGLVIDTSNNDDGTISDIAVTNNEFTDNAFSPILAYSRSNPSAGLNSVEDLTIDGNEFNINASLYAGSFYLLDMRNIGGTNSFAGNTLEITGDLPGGTDAIRALSIRGSRTGTWNIHQNEFDGGGLTHNNSPTVFVTGIAILSADGSTGTLPASAVINITENTITGFEDGIVIRDGVGGVYGNLPAGVDLNIFSNDLSGNSLFAVRTGSTGATIDASANWWGNTDASVIETLVSGDVDFSPYLLSGDSDLLTPGFQGDFETLQVTALGPQSGADGKIQEAVDLVDIGGTVNVLPGTYHDSPNINKSVTLQSTDGRDATTIQLNQIPNGGGYPYGSVYITSGDVTVDGFTILGNDGTASNMANTNIVVGAGNKDNVVIQNNRISVGARHAGSTNGDDALGIVTDYATNPANFIQTLTVSDNIFQPLGASAARAFYINPGVAEFIFEGNEVTGQFDSSSLTVASNSLIENNAITGTGTSGGLGTWGYPDASQFGQGTFRGNTITQTVSGITLNDAENVLIENNSIDNVQTAINLVDVGDFDAVSIAPDASTITIRENSITNVGLAVANGYPVSAANASSNWWGPMDATTIAAAMSGPVDFSPFLLSGDSDLGTPGFQADYSALQVTALGAQAGGSGRIQEAVDLVDVGGTVNVDAGTFTENVVLNQSVSLIGAQATMAATGLTRVGGESIIAGSGASSSFVVSIQADNVTVDGFEITPRLSARDGINVRTGSDAKPGDATIGGYRSGVNLLNNWIHSDAGPIGQRNAVVFGEHVSNANQNFNGQIENVSISGNYIDIPTLSAGGSNSGRGLIFTSQFRNDGATIEFLDFEISGNTIQASATGMFASAPGDLFEFDSLQMTGNTFRNSATGINSGNLHNATITNNIFENNRTNAVVGVINGTISANTFANSNSTGAALQIWGTEYFPQGSNQLTIENNVFTFGSAGDVGGLVIRSGADASTITVHSNQFTNLGQNPSTIAVTNNGNGTLDAVNNWWVTTDAATIAALVSGDVTFSPFADIALTGTSVAEGASIGTAVATLSTTGVDPSTFVYSLVFGDGDTGNASFAIVGDQLQTTEVFDREAQSSYSIRIRSENSDGFYTEEVVTIDVTDVNDNIPVVTPSQTFNVDENSLAGTSVGTVLATDADLNTTFSNWSITGGSGQGLFTIDTNTGALTVTSSNTLDFETTDSYTLTITVFDGVNTSNGETVTVNLNDVNDAPIISAFDYQVTYVENSAPILVDYNALVTDQDPLDFDTGSMTVTLLNGESADQLAIRNQGTAPGQIGISGSQITYSGVTIGTFTGGGGTTPLVVTFNASSTPDAARDVLRNLTFSNSSDNPSAAERTIEVVVTDGDGGTSNTASKSLFITPINDASVLANFTGTVGYTENDSPVLLSSTATVFDVDSPDFSNGRVTVGLVSNYQNTDRIGIQNQGTGSGQIGVSGNQVSYEGTVVGTFTGTTTLYVYLNANSSPAAAQAILRAVTFESLSDAPSTLPRTIRATITDGDGGVSNTQDVTLNLTSVNDAPVIQGFDGSVTYREKQPAVVIDSNAYVSDADLVDFGGGTLTVRLTANAESEDILAVRNYGQGSGQVGTVGNLVTYSGAVVGSFTGGTGGTDLVVTFDAGVDSTSIRAVLRNITFEHTGSNPSITPRTVEAVLTDGDGGTSPAATKSIAIYAVNDAPVIGGFTSTAIYAEDASPVLIEPAATVTDVDSPNFSGGRLLVRVVENRDRYDRVGVRNQGTGSGQIGVSDNIVTYEGTAIGTVTGTSYVIVNFNANATLASVQALMRNITFECDTDAPSTLPRSIAFQVRDGGYAASETVTTTLNVTNSNDVPVISRFDRVVTYRENTDPVAIDTNTTVDDPDLVDFDTATLTVAIAANAEASDLLSIRSIGSGARRLEVSGNSVSYGGVTIGSFTGGDGSNPLVVTFNANAGNTEVQAVLRAVTYQSTSENPSSLARTMTATITDGDGATSATVSTSLNVAPVNDAAVVSSFSGTVSYTENGTPVVLEPTAVVSDVDSANFAGGRVYVRIIENTDSYDRFGIRNDGTGAGQIGVSGGSVTYEGVEIGTFVGTNSLNVSLNANATPEAVQALVRNITFESISDAPSTADRTIQLTVNDGSGRNSDAVFKTVEVTAVNDDPILIGFDTTVTYYEDRAPVSVDTNARVDDPDKVNFDGGVLTVEITANGEASDVLAIRFGQVTVHSDVVYYNGLDVGTVTGNVTSGPLVVTFNGNATAYAVERVLRSITFRNESDNPSDLPRTVTAELTDGAGGSSGVASKTVNVTPVNDAPVLGSFNGTVTYTEGATPVLLNTSGTISDVDSANFNGGRLTIRVLDNRESSDRIGIRNEGTGSGQVGVSGDVVTYEGIAIGTFSGTSTVTIRFNSDAATVAAVQAVLRNVTFSSISDNPSTATRSIEVIVNDGDGGTGLRDYQYVQLIATNDAPVITSWDGSITYRTGGSPLVIDGGASVTDGDQTDFDGGVLTISLDNSESTDMLMIRNVGNGSGQIGISGSDVYYEGILIGTFTGGAGPDPLEITFNANATYIQVRAVIRSITFHSTSAMPVLGDRTATAQLTDGDGGTSAPVSKTIHVA